MINYLIARTIQYFIIKKYDMMDIIYISMILCIFICQYTAFITLYLFC